MYEVRYFDEYGNAFGLPTTIPWVEIYNNMDDAIITARTLMKQGCNYIEIYRVEKFLQKVFPEGVDNAFDL